MTYTKSGRLTVNIQRTNKWIQILDKALHNTQMYSAQKDKILQWATTYKSSQVQIYELIKNDTMPADVP